MSFNYFVEIFELNGQGLKEIGNYCFVSDSSSSIGVGRNESAGIEKVIFSEESEKLLISDPTISSSHGIISFNNDGSFYYQDKGSTNGSYLARREGDELIVGEKVSNVSGKDIYVVLGHQVFLHIYSQQKLASDTQKIDKPEEDITRATNFLPQSKRIIVIKRDKRIKPIKIN